MIFCNCNLKGADFAGVKFKKVAFITTNADVAKNLALGEECYIYRSYPKLELNPEVEKELLKLADYPLLYKYGVLFVNHKKLNKWILQFLIDIYGYRALRAIVALNGRKNKRGFFSVYSYMKHIENYLKL